MIAGWDAIVVGGGPAGCAVSTTLAAWGRRVLLLEGERFPRYHAGESLSPGCWRVLDGMGAGAAVREAGFVPKAGSTFVRGPRRERWSVYYGQSEEERLALHVRRAEFDQILLQQAAAAGVEVREGCRVRRLLDDGDRVVGVGFDLPSGAGRTAEAPWVVDASGRDAFIARRLGLIEYEPRLANGVLWAYWREAGRLPGREAGNLLYADHELGATWSVPIDDGVVCAGAVVRPSALESLRAEPDRLYARMMAAPDAVAPLLAGARQTGPLRVGSASAYCATRLAGEGWLLVGDAACFVDPIISGGVQLALHNGELAALVVNTVLDEPALEGEAAAHYDRLYREQYDAFVRIAVNVYDPPPAEQVPAAPPAGPSPGPPAGAGAPPDAGDRLSFLSVVSGLPRHRLVPALGEHAMLRGRAAERRGVAMTLGEEEGFAFLTRLFHRERLQANRARRIGEELTGDSVLRLAAGATIGAELFLPDGGQRRLTARRAVANRFGDRFEASRELDALLTLVDGRRPCDEVERRFGERLGAGRIGADAFRRWIQLLADEGLIEWQREGDRVLLSAGEGTPCAG